MLERTEAKKVLWFVGILLVIFVAIFRATNLFKIVLFWVMVLYLFYLPGYFLSRPFRKQLDFLTRSIMGMAVALCMYIVVAYHLGIFGLSIHTYAFVLPLVVTGLGLLAAKLLQE